MAKNNGDEPKPVGLADVLQQLRHELETSNAATAAQGKVPVMDWESAEVEIHFVVTKTGKGKAEFDIGVLTIGGGGEYSAESTHKLSVKLVPHKAGGASAGGSARGD